jgi:predicted AAA+ superfamily ATPase
VSRDVLSLGRIDKPALLRQLFYLAWDYSGQIVSYTKLVGQLQDAGNTTTLAEYLKRLADAWLVVGLQRYSGRAVRDGVRHPSCWCSTRRCRALPRD